MKRKITKSIAVNSLKTVKMAQNKKGKQKSTIKSLKKLKTSLIGLCF